MERKSSQRMSLTALILTCLLLSQDTTIAQTTVNLPAMFSDNLLTDLAPLTSNVSYFITNTLNNSQLVTRFESSKHCAYLSQTSLLTNILKNPNSNSNSFESKRSFFSCLQLVELFCNPSLSNRFVASHSLFDCESYLVPSDYAGNLIADSNTNPSFIKIVNLGTSNLQLAAVLSQFLDRFYLTNFGIVYSISSSSSSEYDLIYYQQRAADLVYRLSVEGDYVLDFSYSLNDQRISSYLSQSPIVFLMLRCGEEIEFMNNYGANLGLTVFTNVIAIYDSPQCLAMANYYTNSMNLTQISNYQYMYKLVPFDSTVSSYSAFLGSITSAIKPNLTGSYQISNLLEELEDFYFLNNYSVNSSQIYLNDTSSFIQLKCFLSMNTNLNANEDSFRYCYRRLNYQLYGLNNSTSMYTSVANLDLSDLFNIASSFNVTITMPQDFTFSSGSKKTTRSEEIFRDILFGIIGLIILLVIIIIIAYILRSRLMRKELSLGPNKILLLPDDLEFIDASSSTMLSKTHVRNGNNRSNVSVQSADEPKTSDKDAIKIAKYKGDVVVCKFLKIPNFQIKNSTIRELKKLRELRHENLNTLVGCFIDIKAPSIVYEYGPRGSLQDIILKKEIKLDWNFKWSMLNDLCRGMRYVHHSPLKYHGNLKSRNCIVDSRWVLKLTDFGLPGIYANQKFSRTLNISDLLWTAPEHLRQTTIRDQVVISTGSPSGDIYSFAIIMQELIIGGKPFCMLGLSDEEIINKVRKPPPLLRPSVSKTAAPPEYVNIMRDCWSEQPELRPSFDQLCSMFKSLNGDKKVNIVDLMFKMIEQYTNNLEDLIKEKTIKLEEEKKKSEKLLMEMLPKTVAESLISGGSVQPESYDCVTIYFSDIVGFTTISAYSSPFEVVQLLNDLYTMFDEILTNFDVYKVETIGDAYMVVSGLPLRNGNRHAGEIATMALNLLHHCGQFKIQYLPGVPLRLRIGIHSGACVTGVVGMKMPRYCLFGDTVNTASRMESTSQAYRIHVSQAAATILDEIGGYHLEFRGITELKGKGKHKTYWLVGQDGFDKSLPDPVESENNHGIDAELIKTIERIRADQKAHEARVAAEMAANAAENKENKPAELEEKPANLDNSLTENADVNNNNNISLKEIRESERRPSTPDPNPQTAMGSNKAIQSKRRQSAAYKNDSGYSETTNGTTSNGSSPPNNKMPPIESSGPTTKKHLKRMPDIDSVA